MFTVLDHVDSVTLVVANVWSTLFLCRDAVQFKSRVSFDRNMALCNLGGLGRVWQAWVGCVLEKEEPCTNVYVWKTYFLTQSVAKCD
jgi:hypothetical protein